jgi:AraC family transcriptional regulator of adaptative response / DNA-3-methyladenine glycosylase II
MMDTEHCYRAVQSRDSRFDGCFVTAVTSTGIYCRPSCPAVTPRRSNVRFFRTGAAAQVAGFRSCKRCRPDATPGSPEWNLRADLVGRAMRLIADGVVDREGVAGLARRLGYSERQLHRALVAEVGTGAQALARAQRAQTARLLVETTRLPMTDIAFAAGFASTRQFNETLRAVFATNPTDLRRRSQQPVGSSENRFGGAGDISAAGTVTLQLPYRPPLDVSSLLDFLAARAVPGVEEVRDGVYRRTLALHHAPGIIALVPALTGEPVMRVSLQLGDLRDLGAVVQRCRRLLDLDADPFAVDGHLGADPLMGDLVRRRPGLRVPGHVDGYELATRAVLGQQVSVPAARTLAARLVTALGKPLTAASGSLTHLFPTADAVAAVAPEELPVPSSRGRALLALAGAVADGDVRLDPGAERDEVRRALLALPGIGPWTADYVLIRALGDPDTLLPGDLGVRTALARLGVGTPAAALVAAQRWRPWRSYAVAHLWRSLS